MMMKYFLLAYMLAIRYVIACCTSRRMRIGGYRRESILRTCHEHAYTHTYLHKRTLRVSCSRTCHKHTYSNTYIHTGSLVRAHVTNSWLQLHSERAEGDAPLALFEVRIHKYTHTHSHAYTQSCMHAYVMFCLRC